MVNCRALGFDWGMEVCMGAGQEKSDLRAGW